MVNTCDFSPAMWCFKYKLTGLAFNCTVLGPKGYTSVFLTGLQLLLEVAQRSLLQKWQFWNCPWKWAFCKGSCFGISTQILLCAYIVTLNGCIC